jgi:hypothetical protein
VTRAGRRYDPVAMRTIDDVEFTRRGGRGLNGSAYAFCKTTCCGNWCVRDLELDDLYFDGQDLGKVISLLGLRGEPAIVCPFCGVRDWRPEPVDDFEGIPQSWVWGLSRG